MPTVTPAITSACPSETWCFDHCVEITGEYRTPRKYDIYYVSSSGVMAVGYKPPLTSHWILRASSRRTPPRPSPKQLSNTHHTAFEPRYELTGDVGIPKPGEFYWCSSNGCVKRQRDSVVYSPVWIIRARVPEAPDTPVPWDEEWDGTFEDDREFDGEERPLHSEPVTPDPIFYDDRSKDDIRREKEWNEYLEYKQSL